MSLSEAVKELIAELHRQKTAVEGRLSGDLVTLQNAIEDNRRALRKVARKLKLSEDDNPEKKMRMSDSSS